MTSRATAPSPFRSMDGAARNRDHSFLVAPLALLDDQQSDNPLVVQ